jgi:hypothetical protein
MIGGPAQIEIIKGGPSAQVVLELGSFSHDQMSLRAELTATGAAARFHDLCGFCPL